MPTIDLGSVVGPQGAQGNTGPQGEQGVAGPSLISASTQTTLTGVLAGDGSTVGVRAVDPTPVANSTNLVASGGVYNALAERPVGLAADLILHVNATSGDDSDDGLTAATALETINAAFAKIPANMAGRRAIIQLANGTYASATLGVRYGGTFQISNDTGATQANIKIQGLSISSSCSMTSVFISNVTFNGGNLTTDYHVLGGFLRVASCTFDNARLVNQGGQCYVNNCTFRNISSSAIYGWQSDLFITSATIESTVTGTGVVTQGGVVTAETITNLATSQYSTSQGGRIFVGTEEYGGRTIHKDSFDTAVGSNGEFIFSTDSSRTVVSCVFSKIGTSTNPTNWFLEYRSYSGKILGAKLLNLQGQSATSGTAVAGTYYYINEL